MADDGYRVLRPGEHPPLTELLTRAKSHVMTEEEQKAQRESWAKGQAAIPERGKLVPEDGGKKFDGGKVRMELFPADVLMELLSEEYEPGAMGHVEEHFLGFAGGADQQQLVLTLIALAREQGVTVWELARDISEILTFGAGKYGDHNWRKGMKWSRLIGAALRHWAAAESGTELDDETGKPHLWHFGCCAVFLLSYAMNGSGTDDRYRP